jgi:hypothetical protein
MRPPRGLAYSAKVFAQSSEALAAAPNCYQAYEKASVDPIANGASNTASWT